MLTSQKMLAGIKYLIAAFVVLSVTMFFLAENGRMNAFPTYFIAIAVLLAMLFEDTRTHLASMPVHLSILVVVLLEYLSISAWWSMDGNFQQVTQHQGYAALILTFVMAMTLSNKRFDNFLLILLITTLAAASVSAAISIQLHYALPEYQPLPEPRLFGFGRLNNPVISSVSYGFAAVLGVYLTQQLTQVWQRLLLLACIVVLLIAITLSGTRVAWLALGLAGGTGLAIFYRARPVLVFSMTLVAIGLIAIAAVGWEDLTKRALSFRPEIWAEFISRSLEANPLLGAGSGSDSHWETSILVFKHPHSIFVSAFFYGGIVGLVLLVSLFVTCGIHLLKADDSPIRQIALMTLVYGVTVGLFDGDNVLTKIDHLWWIVWFPVSLTLCVSSASDRPAG